MSEQGAEEAVSDSAPSGETEARPQARYWVVTLAAATGAAMGTAILLVTTRLEVLILFTVVFGTIALWPAAGAWLVLRRGPRVSTLSAASWTFVLAIPFVFAPLYLSPAIASDGFGIVIAAVGGALSGFLGCVIERRPTRRKRTRGRADATSSVVVVALLAVVMTGALYVSLHQGAVLAMDLLTFYEQPRYAVTVMCTDTMTEACAHKAADTAKLPTAWLPSVANYAFESMIAFDGRAFQGFRSTRDDLGLIDLSSNPAEGHGPSEKLVKEFQVNGERAELYRARIAGRISWYTLFWYHEKMVYRLAVSGFWIPPKEQQVLDLLAQVRYQDPEIPIVAAGKQSTPTG